MMTMLPDNVVSIDSRTTEIQSRLREIFGNSTTDVAEEMIIAGVEILEEGLSQTELIQSDTMAQVLVDAGGFSAAWGSAVGILMGLNRRARRSGK